MIVNKRAASLALAIALAAIAGTVLMPRLDATSSRAVREGLQGFRGRLDARLGLSLSFDSLSPSILSSASFSGLSIKAPGGRPLLTARRVRVRYNIFAILRGKGAGAISGLELADVSLDLRLPEDEEILARISSLVSGEGSAQDGGELPRIVISGKNVVARLSAEGRGSASFVARDVEFSTLEDEPVVTLDGRFSLEPSGGGPWPVSGPLSFSGSVARDFKRARINLSLAADSRDFSLSMQRFELVYGNDELFVTKVKDRAPLDAALRIGLKDGGSSASIKLDGFVPSRSVRVSGRFAWLKPWLDIPFRGSIQVSAAAGEAPGLSYEARLSGFLPGSLWSGKAAAISAELAVKGDERRVEIERARAERGSEFVEYRGGFRFADLSPDGVLDLNLALAGGELPLTSSFHLVGQGGEYAVLADQVTAGGVAFKDIALTARRKGSLADFKLSFVPPESEAQIADASASSIAFAGEAGASSGLPLVRCEGSASFGAQPLLELSLGLEQIDLGPMQALISALTGSPEAAAIIAKLKLSGEFFATSDFKKLSWSAPDLTIVSRASPGTYALLALSGTTTSVAVKRAVVSLSGRTIEGQAEMDFSEAGRLAFEAKLSLMDFPLAFHGVFERGELSLSGDYGLAVSVKGQGDDRHLSLRASALPVPIGGGLFLATVDAEGRYASVEDWYLSVSEFLLEPAGEKVAVLPRIELAGAFAPRSAALSTLRVQDRYSGVSGDASLAYSLQSPVSARISAKLVSPPAAKSPSILESYKLDLEYSEAMLSGSIDLIGSPIARLGKLPLTGYADGKLALRGKIADPDLDFTLALREGRLGDQSLALSGSGSYGHGLLKLRDLQAAYQGNTISGAAGSFSFLDAKGEFALGYSGSFNDKSLSFKVIAQGASTRQVSKATLAERFASYEATGSMRGFALGDQTMEDWPFRFTSDSGNLSFLGGPSGELRAKYSPGGLISASLHNPLPAIPISAELSCLYDGKSIDLSIQSLEFDIAALQPFMPQKIIRLKGGKARGGLRAIGMAKDPEITGELNLIGASVKVLGWVADDIGPFNAPVIIQGRKIEFSVPAAPSGKAVVALGFQATVDHWLPTGIDAFARTAQGSLLQLDAVILGIQAKGEAAADVRFSYPGGGTLRLDIDVAIAKGEVVVSTETLASGGGEASNSRPSLWIDVAANVRLARGVQVFFPSTAFPIVAGYSDSTSSLAILYDQEASDFSLKGTVALRGGEVFYVQRNFFLKNGKIVFNEGTDRFEPRVTLLAELRDRNENGPVLIRLKADNAPISTFKPTLSSDPIMSEAEIAAMMGQSIFGTDGEKSVNFRTTAISASEFIPQLNVARVLENKIRDASGLDIFYLRTQVLQNWLIDMSQAAASDSGNPLSRYFDRTSIYIGKYLDDSIFAYGSLGIRESTPLVGSTTSIINYDIGVELDAPFGRLTWALAPEDWKTLKFRDQSLSLSWKLSY